MSRMRLFPESNYRAIYVNNRVYRFRVRNDEPILGIEYPEFYDVKITSKCNGDCPWCYMDSGPNATHFKDIVDKADKFFGSMEMNQRPFQVACLDGDTLVSTETGMRPIKDIQIGDKVFSETGTLSTVTNKTATDRESIEIIGTKGFRIIASPDHLFSVSGKMVEAEKLIGLNLDTAYYSHGKSTINTIDLTKFVNASSKIPGKRGGSSGGIVTDKTIAFMHTLTSIPRTLKLTSNLMWLYGLSVAEGSKRGLSLGAHETKFANKAANIYNKITGLPNTAIRSSRNNVLQVEFQESKTYRTIFFEALEIGYGARNKSIKFLYKLDTELIKFALRGMFEGDGCFRKRFDKRHNRFYFTLSYKTTSKILAHELVHILQTKFNVKSSLYHGISPDRQIEDRTLKASDYYMIDIYGNQNINKIFPDIFKNDNDYNELHKSIYSANKDKNVKITSVKSVGIKKLYDITLDNNSSHLFTLSHGIITHNCGGGEPTMHYDFIPLMEKLVELGITPNYTTNGMFVDKDYADDIIHATERLCAGVAVSCHPHIESWWSRAINELAKIHTSLNLHIIMSDNDSVKFLKRLVEQYRGIVKNFVLLPYVPMGRAEPKEIDFDTIFAYINSLDTQSDIAYGAGFYQQIANRNMKQVSLYEPEIFSGFLDMDNMILYKSSFNLEPR